HTIIGLVLDEADTVHKVTIVPRGMAGGYAMMLPKEDRFLRTKKELFDRIIGLLGGRVAEEIIYGKENVSVGASNDFQRATEIAQQMVTEYGICAKICRVRIDYAGRLFFLGRSLGKGRSHSEAIDHDIDIYIQSIINDYYLRAKQF